MQGVKILDTPQISNTIDWAFEHIGCDALVKKDDSCSTMTILAYALDKEYNKELLGLLSQFKDSMVFKNISSGEVNSID